MVTAFAIACASLVAVPVYLIWRMQRRIEASDPAMASETEADTRYVTRIQRGDDTHSI